MTSYRVRDYPVHKPQLNKLFLIHISGILHGLSKQLCPILQKLSCFKSWFQVKGLKQVYRWGHMTIMQKYTETT